MSGKRKKNRLLGVLAALLGAVCALILCALFYGTMVYQLAGETSGDAVQAEGAKVLALISGDMESESRQTVRVDGQTCDVLTRVYRMADGTSVQAVTASPAAYIGRIKEEGWQAQLITGFAVAALDAVYARKGEEAMLCAREGDTVYMLIAETDEQTVYALGAGAKLE